MVLRCSKNSTDYDQIAFKLFTIYLYIFFFFLLEIAKVRASLFQINGVRKEPLKLPEADGVALTMNEKVYVPVKEHPDVSNFF